jgi:hypothetical protein
LRTFTHKYLGGLPVPEDHYKVDLAVLDRYQAFSGELLRLALLGIAGYGFLISNTLFKGDAHGKYPLMIEMAKNREFLLAGIIALAFSAASALIHRFYSTDCLTHFVRRLRLLKSISEMPEDPRVDEWRTSIEKEEDSLDKDVATCRWLLVAAAAMLVVGFSAVTVVFGSTAFHTPAG